MPKFSSNSERTAFDWALHVPLESINDTHVQSAYRLNLKLCSQKPNSCKRNCRGNPRCLYGLGEKKWLNNKDEDFLTDFENPNDERKKADTFVGLKNLGATCYVNSLLQVWFHNPFLREAIYKWKPDDDQKEIREQLNKSLQEVEIVGGKKSSTFTPVSPVGQLQLIFTRLQFSLRCFVDPTPFVNSLELDVSTQQDAQEFSKLFLTLIEEDLSHQKNPIVRNIVQTQYCGEYVYITRCQNCSTESKSPSKFYELGLNIKGHKDIYECLEEFFAPEVLEGSNQFFCNTCQSKQDVVRYVKLQKLPPYLNLQLLRFVFDRQKGRRKLNSFIKFPETLSLSKYFDNGVDVPEKVDYNLCAVLMHRGQSAHSGHYIAQIKDRITGDWFKFNDEFVEKIEGKNLKLGFEENADDCILLDNNNKSGNSSEEKHLPKLIKGQHASNDAYMLVYKSASLDDRSLPPDDSFKWDIPEYLQTVLLEDNSQFEERVEIYNQMKNQSLAVNKERQDEIKSTFDTLTQNENINKSEWISRQWLNQWLSLDVSKTIPSIVNSTALCAHDRLSIGAVDQMKLINSQGADLIFAKYGGDVRLKDCLCLECVQNKAESIRRRHKINEDSKQITSLLKFSLPIEEKAYWVGKESLKVWKHLALRQCDLFESSFMMGKQRNNSGNSNSPQEASPEAQVNGEIGNTNQNSSSENGDSDSENKPPSQSDQGSDQIVERINFNFNEDILCPHFRLSYDESKRRLVSPPVWNLLKSHFANASEFDSETTPCEECFSLSLSTQSFKDEQKLLALSQKQQLNDLYSQKRKITLEEMQIGHFYYALSTEFFSFWKHFIRDSSHNDAPETIDNSTLLCSHNLILYPPTRIDHNTPDFKYLIISEQDWNKLMQFYQSEFVIKFSVKLNERNEKVFTSEPECCESCYADLRKLEQESLLNYEKAIILVRRVQAKCETEDANDESTTNDDDQTDKSFIECASKKFKKVSTESDPLLFTGGDCRKPRRSTRRRKYRDVKEFVVSSSFTLLQLKVQIMKVFKIPPYDQNLFLNEVPLEGNDKTLSELNITPNSLVCLKADEPIGGFSMIEEDFIKGAVPETGFKGTKLCNREDE